MTNETTINVLNHLLAIHARSLPIYLSSARPYLGRNGDGALQVLRDIARDHQAMVERIGETIIDAEGIVSYGEFPMKYTGWNDLSMNFLIGRCIEAQQLDITRIEKCIQWLQGSPRAKVLAEESLGEAKAHLEALEELQKPNVATIGS